MKKIPIILDTDLGGDIDDAWALAFLLCRPELDLRLVIGTSGDTTYRAGLIRRMLAAAGRRDIPVIPGIPTEFNPVRQNDLEALTDEKWDHADFRKEMTKIIEESAEPVTIIGIAPLTNLASWLEGHADLAAKVDLVLMSGSINENALGVPGAAPEWNVVCDVAAAQKIYTTQWHSFTITPVDSSNKVKLQGNWFVKLRDSSSALCRELSLHYLAWMHIWGFTGENDINGVPTLHTSALYDTVSVALIVCRHYLKMEMMNLVISDEGIMEQRADGMPVDVAIGWQNLEGFKKELATYLTK